MAGQQTAHRSPQCLSRTLNQLSRLLTVRYSTVTPHRLRCFFTSTARSRCCTEKERRIHKISCSASVPFWVFFNSSTFNCNPFINGIDATPAAPCFSLNYLNSVTRAGSTYSSLPSGVQPGHSQRNGTRTAVNCGFGADFFHPLQLSFHRLSMSRHLLHFLPPSL